MPTSTARVTDAAAHSRRRMALFAVTALAACDANPAANTGIRRDDPFRSAILSDDVILRYRLPPGYDANPSLRYPVIFQLDPTYLGLQQMEWTVGAVSTAEARGEIPATLVVGVDFADSSHREDYFPTPDTASPAYDQGRADLFYRAMRDEIVPRVDAALRTQTDRRYLFGHSLGGVFSLYAAFRHAPPEPPLFAGHVANDPGITQALFTFEGFHAARSSSLPIRIYRVFATYDGWIQATAHRWMTERLDGRHYEGFAEKVEELVTDHGGTVGPGYTSGVAYLLGGGQ